jgi:hypothetical protein
MAAGIVLDETSFDEFKHDNCHQRDVAIDFVRRTLLEM